MTDEQEAALTDEAIVELLKHGVVNFVFHGVLAFAVTMVAASISPIAGYLVFEVASVADAVVTAGFFGLSAGLIGMMLAIERSRKTDLNRYSVLGFFLSVKDRLSGESKKGMTGFYGDRNGKVYQVSKHFCVRAKRRLRDYLLYYQRRYE